MRALRSEEQVRAVAAPAAVRLTRSRTLDLIFQKLIEEVRDVNGAPAGPASFGSQPIEPSIHLAELPLDAKLLAPKGVALLALQADDLAHRMPVYAIGQHHHSQGRVVDGGQRFVLDHRKAHPSLGGSR
jgi:hypothetical protein